ncbi:MAG: hypothetical protein HY527_21695 [Betaproteobacteria bacterium]|nr:hypothetical protein [Betaproteobacteria bacterium]
MNSKADAALAKFDAIVEGRERALATGTQAMSDDPRLPKVSDFPPGTAFMIKEFDVPLARVPGQGWVCWYGGTPRPYDPRSLKVDNNWLADSFEEWVGVVAESLGGTKTDEEQAKVDALAGIKPRLLSDQARLPGSRLLEGRFTAIQQAIGTPVGRNAGAQFLTEFVAQAKTSGLVARAIETNGVRGVTVAP